VSFTTEPHIQYIFLKDHVNVNVRVLLCRRRMGYASIAHLTLHLQLLHEILSYACAAACVMDVCAAVVWAEGITCTTVSC
jgi:hypothetical protein